MTSKARDVRYGRRGGGWSDNQHNLDIDAAPRCTVCDRPVLVEDGGVHRDCKPTEPGELEGQTSMFPEDAA
jgi:hypothetical protein